MKKVLSLLIVVAGYESHAAINQKSNADCGQRKSGYLHEVTVQAPKSPVAPKQTPEPTQLATNKTKAQNT